MFSGEEGMQEIVNKLLTIWISALFFQLYADFIILPQVAAKSEKHGTVCAAAVRRPGERERRQEPYFSLVRGAERLQRGCSWPGAALLPWVLVSDVVTDDAYALRKPQIYANLRKSRTYAPALSPA